MGGFNTAAANTVVESFERSRRLVRGADHDVLFGSLCYCCIVSEAVVLHVESLELSLTGMSATIVNGSKSEFKLFVSMLESCVNSNVPQL